MNSDFDQFPKDRQMESNSAPADAEEKVVNSVNDSDSNSIIPSGEINSVLVYLEEQKKENIDFDVANTSLTQNLETSNSELTGLDLNSNELGLPEQNTSDHTQVQFKTEAGKLLLILPTESQLPASDLSWSEIWQQIRQRINGSDRLWKSHTIVNLVAKDRLLDSRQLQELAETLGEIKLELESVTTSRRQTAIAACTLGYSVEQIQLQPSLTNNPQIHPQPLADALYLEMTVRSGGEIRHPGTVIILGDINPGGIVIADGDILVWGRLRGVAHAGARGNRDCQIMALQMEPTQLRIADAVARAPEKSLTQFFPEVAHITPQGIRIAKATDFSRTQLSKMNQNL